MSKKGVLVLGWIYLWESEASAAYGAERLLFARVWQKRLLVTHVCIRWRFLILRDRRRRRLYRKPAPSASVELRLAQHNATLLLESRLHLVGYLPTCNPTYPKSSCGSQAGYQLHCAAAINLSGRQIGFYRRPEFPRPALVLPCC